MVTERLRAVVIERLRAARVVPVVRTTSAAHAERAVVWLRDAGLRIFELTMTIPDAPALIRSLAQETDLLIGAGTVSDAPTATACLEAGAAFIVAPWTDPALAAPCRAHGATLMLGAVTPTEVRAALTAGADVVKIFPAASAGGPAHIRALRSVLPDVAFCPTGGIAPKDVGAFLAAGAAFVGMGGALVDEARIAAGDRGAIEAAAREGDGGMTDLVCMGEPMLEFNQQQAVEAGEPTYRAGHGGDTSNAAIAAARQGARVTYLTAVGRDTGGASFLQLWRSEGIETTHVVQDPVNPTAVYLVHHGAGGHEFQYYRQGSAASAYAPTHVPDEAIRGAKILFASGISQGISNSAADAVFHAIDLARGAGVRVAYDTNYRPRLWPPARASAIIHAAIAQSSIALPSLDDARLLTGLSDPDAIVDFYLHLGPSLVALKMGAAGTVLATPTERLRIAAFPCEPVDATGAGDTFCGAFLARLVDGDAPPEAATYAACAAALSTTGYGAVPPIPRADAVRAALARHT